MDKKILLLILTTYLTAVAFPSFAQQKKTCGCGDCCGSCFSMAAEVLYPSEKKDVRNFAPEGTVLNADSRENLNTGSQTKKNSDRTYHFALRTNLLRWATLTPDLSIEWRINRSVGIVVDGSYTSWAWKDCARRYALWEVNPEVRWYLGQKKNCYVGAMFKAGAFSYKFTDTGKQGNLLGGGVTGGYILNLSDALALDFSLGLGYVRADFDEYSVVDGMYLRDGEQVKNWWGPTKVGVTLVWKIF